MDDLAKLFHVQSQNRWAIRETTAKERIVKLKRLKSQVKKRREDIKLALYNDFKKPFAESELLEIHPVLAEINFVIKNLKQWMKPKKVSTPLILFKSSSEIHYEARGQVLILSPWNYPFSLLLKPMIAAIAAGNCIIGRPSEKTPHTGKLIKEIIEEVFDSSEIALVLGEIQTAEQLLELPFDHIFFTGSTAIGKKVMAAAAKNLATVTLELGGKSPVIVGRDVDLKKAVSRIAWGKYINGGQTCVAPDYLFVPEELKDKFLKLFLRQIKNRYGETSLLRLNNPDFARLIDQASFKRLSLKLEGEKNWLNDESFSDQNYLAPTLIETTLNSPLMDEEIFGPILPVIPYKHIDEVISYIRSRPKPLALYVFSKEKKFIKKILRATTSGGAAVNHVLLHLANPHLPFGGIGHSGQGSYHGHFGFKAFSHEKSVFKQGYFSLSSFCFPPYSRWVSKLFTKFLRLFE